MRIQQLFERHHLRVFRFALRLTGRRELAEDLTQEVFLRALGGARGYREQEREEAWLFRIARNLWIDRGRALERRPRPMSVSEAPEPFEPSGGPGLSLGLRQALARLKVEEREAFLLREVAGLSYSEIGALSDASRDAVASRIYRARRTLRRALADHESSDARRRLPRGTDLEIVQ